ncbi:MAG: AAA-like domain-containing protein [Armatimonadetes bacterium]|nr:AAA-like domain-containing protein [Armatimonadota bacterium]
MSAVTADCDVRFFGQFEVRILGSPVDRFRTRKAASLFAYLALLPGRRHPREALADMLWPESDDSRHSLSMALTFIRHEVEVRHKLPEGAVLRTNRMAVSVDDDVVTSDAARFDAALTAASAASAASDAEAMIERLVEAVGLYRGEMLPGFYDEWAIEEQHRHRERFLDALERLVVAATRCDRPDFALEHALLLVAEDPFREAPYRHAAALYLALGRRDRAARLCAEMEKRIHGELGVPLSEDARHLQALCHAAPQVRRAPARDTVKQAAGTSSTPHEAPEPPRGAVPLGSRYYVVRPTDQLFHDAISRGDSIVLLRGARQVGKTSLLARGLQAARESGETVASAQLQMLDRSILQSSGELFLALARELHEQLDLPDAPDDVWDARRGASPNLRRYFRRTVLPAAGNRLIWGLDEVDRLFGAPCADDLFSLLRSWNDERALDPAGQWSALTVVIAYSTEAHMLITDLNQSPFNVGTHISLRDFTQAEVDDLNVRHGSPLRTADDRKRFAELLGGHPFLVRQGLYQLTVHGWSLQTLERDALLEQGPYGDHLRRIGSLLARDGNLLECVQRIAEGAAEMDRDSFYRLRSAGIVAGESATSVSLRCGLYACYISQLGA